MDVLALGIRSVKLVRIAGSVRFFFAFSARVVVGVLVGWGARPRRRSWQGRGKRREWDFTACVVIGEKAIFSLGSCVFGVVRALFTAGVQVGFEVGGSCPGAHLGTREARKRGER